MNDTVRTILVVVLVIGLGGWGAIKLGQKAWPHLQPLYLVHKEIKKAVPEVNADLHTSGKEVKVTATAGFNVAKEEKRCDAIAKRIHAILLQHVPDARVKPTVIHILDLDSLLRHDPKASRSYRFPPAEVAQAPVKSK